MKERAVVYSVYMSNVDPKVPQYQRECVQKYLPKGWKFKQVLHSMSHGDALYWCVENNKEEYTIFLDIDCIPVSHTSFTYLFDPRWAITSGALIGAAQRANHIRNNDHIYVGPFCMAFKNSTYQELGKSTFHETTRGDIGEELTYQWQGANKPVYLFWPSNVQKPLWSLIPGVSEFGFGTTYEDLFYHAFCARNSRESTNMFVDKCKSILSLEDEAGEKREEVSA